jgi:hypothetical protein
MRYIECNRIDTPTYFTRYRDGLTSVLDSLHLEKYEIDDHAIERGKRYTAINLDTGITLVHRVKEGDTSTLTQPLITWHIPTPIYNKIKNVTKQGFSKYIKKLTYAHIWEFCIDKYFNTISKVSFSKCLCRDKATIIYLYLIFHTIDNKTVLKTWYIAELDPMTRLKHNRTPGYLATYPDFHQHLIDTKKEHQLLQKNYYAKYPFKRVRYCNQLC